MIQLDCYYSLSSPWAYFAGPRLQDIVRRHHVAIENDLDGEALLAAETSVQVQQLYQQYSAEAEALGVFGAPTYVLDGERYWGQDRLEFVDRALDAIGS